MSVESVSDQSDSGDYPIRKLHAGLYKQASEEEDFDKFRIDDENEQEIIEINSKYDNRIHSKSFQAFDDDLPQHTQYVDPTVLSAEGVQVHMNSITRLIPGKQQNRKFIHTWEDLSVVNTVEAERTLQGFFTSQYFKHSKWGSPAQRNQVDVNLSNNIRHYCATSVNGLRVFHYIGLGFPPPENGKICIKDNGFSPDDWKSMTEIRQTIQSNLHFIFDCDRAASLIEALNAKNKQLEKSYYMQNISAMFACGANDFLHIPETLPQDIFTCILLDPERSIRSLNHNLDNVSDSTLKSLINIFTESIARDNLDHATFHTYFTEPDLLSTLWRNFILAQRLMKQFGITVHSIPEIPDCSEHHLWQQFEYALRCRPDCQISTITDLHRSQFLTVPKPSKTIRAFISTLLKNNDLYETIIVDIAKFMKRSPLMCSKMAPYLESKYIAQNLITQERSINGSRAWNIVISGILLAEPGNTNPIARCLEGTRVMELIKNEQTDDICRRYLISTVVVLGDGKTHLLGLLGTDSSVHAYFPFILDSQTPPETRLLYCTLVQAILSRSHAHPSDSFKARIHRIGQLLLKEESALFRAVGVCILASLMYHNADGFNSDLLKLALPAVLDGSYRVRLPLIAMIHRYIELGGKIGSSQTADVYKLLNNEIEDPTEYLSDIISFLTNDPYDEARIKALDLQTATENEDSLADEKLRDAVATLQRTVHCSLFSEGRIERKFKQEIRYTDSILDGSGLELLETISNNNSGSISSLSFSKNHDGVICGCAGGSVIWGSSSWRPASSTITDVCHLGGNCIAASSSPGFVYVLKKGHEKPVDCFQAGMEGDRGARTHIFSCDTNPSDVYISTGGTEAVRWDLSAMKPISCLKLRSQISCATRNDNEFVVAMRDGSIVAYDNRTPEYRTLREATNSRQIIRVGFHKKSLYYACECGTITYVDTGKQSEVLARSSDVMIHPVLDYGVVVGGEISLIDTFGKKVAVMNSVARGCRCCFDGERPLAAIGNVDGSVAIWRLPNTI